MGYTKLRITCETCDARKINEENYKGYEEIVINAEEMIVDDRSKAILSRLPFHISAEEMHSKETNSREDHSLNVNGIYEIHPGLSVENGVNLCVNGILKIKAGSEAVLGQYDRISVNGILLCPESVSSMLSNPKFSINGKTKVYPDEYTLLDNRYKLDRFFPMRAASDGGYFAASFIYDNDQETDFDALAKKSVKFSTEKVYIRHSHLESALPLFNIEAEVVEVPDDYKIYVTDSGATLEEAYSACGSKIFVIGDISIGKESAQTLGEIAGLVVEDEIKIDAACLDRFNAIGAKYGRLQVIKGLRLEDRAMLTLDFETLENHPEGVTVSDCALVKIDSAIPGAMIRERLKIRDCAKVSCSKEQEAAVSEVSRDVAMIGSAGGFVGKVLRGIFGGEVAKDGDTFDTDTKYVNAEYYEL